MMIAPACEVPDSAAEILALFAEARRRRRRRRAAGLAVGLVLCGAAAIGLAGGGQHSDPAARAAASARPPAVIARQVAYFALPAARVAWVDYFGQLHVGEVATGAQRVVATVPSAAGGWLVGAGGHLYWPDFTRNVAPIRDYDLASGKIRYLARGESVFASADGRHIYVVRSGTALIELRADGSGAPVSLAVPAGWHLSDPWPLAVAGGGIVVYANGDARSSPSLAFAVWTPRTGQLKIIGRDGGAMIAYTPRGARYSLLAWSSGPCASRDCPIKITNTSTLATVTVRSPLRHGFAGEGAAFSPDGTRLAVFARTASLSPYRDNASDLAIVDTRTGRLRLVPAVRLSTTEDAGWVRWLPGGRQLLAGALSYSYAVDAQTLAARGFFFSPGAASRYGDHNIMDSGDINFSATVLPPAAGLMIRRSAPPQVPALPQLPGRPQ